MNRLVYLFLVLLVSCGGKTTAKQSSQSEDQSKLLVKLQPIVKPENDHVVIGAKKREEIAFSKYKALCLTIEGTKYDERDRVCKCVQNGVKATKFAMITSLSDRRKIEPRCEEIEPLSPPDSYSSFLDYLNEAGEEKFKDQFRNVFQKYRAVPDFVFSNSVDGEYLRKLAIELDKKPLFLDIPQSYGKGTLQNIRLGIQREDRASLMNPIKGLSKIWGNFVRSPTTVYGPSYDIFVQDVKNVHSVLGVPSDVRKGWIFPDISNDSPNKEELAKLKNATIKLNGYLFRGEEELQNTRYRILLNEDGCHLRCFVSLEFTSNNEQFRYEKMYIYGEIVAARLLRFDRDVIASGGTYRSLVYFGKGDSISMVLVNTRVTDGISAGWRFDVFDESLKHTFSFDEKRITDSDLLLSSLDIPNDEIGNTSPVIMLERIVDYRDRELMKWVKKGPFRSTSYIDGGSVFGWKNAKKGDTNGFDYNLFYDGLFTDDLNNPQPNDTYYHANFVGRQILGSVSENTSVSIIPTSSYEYTNDRMEDLYRIVRQSGARVINLSAMLLIDGKHSCPLNDTRLSIDALWVLAAGNDGLENPEDGCEQNLKPLHRKLVVAANIEDGLELEYYSDFGTEYADLSASGVAYDMHGERTEGTSFASPKVSNTVATIVNRYGSNLTNQLIRMAILLSVDVDVYSPMATRSGGRLNKENALAAAGYMNGVVNGSIDFPYNLTKKQIMARIIRASGSLTDDDEISKQVDWLTKNGI